jgi:transporter family protein
MIMAFTFLLGIVTGALGAILMKIGATRIGHVELHSIAQIFSYIFKLFTTLQSVAGITLYFLSALIWSYLLTKLDISFVQPILALTYVLTPLLAIFILKEQMPAARWLGIFVIIIGVFIVARTGR